MQSRDMDDVYSTCVRFLRANGWIERPDGFSNGYVLLVFDTSNYVEVYKSNGERIAESRITTLQDFKTFLTANRLDD